MRNFYRVISLILILLVFLSVNTGCNNLNKENTNGEGIVISNLKRATLTFYFPTTAQSSFPDMQEVIRELEKKAGHLNINLNFIEVFITQYAETIKSLIASNGQLDAFLVGAPERNGIDFTSMARNGELADISTLLSKTAPSLYNKYSEGELNWGKINGKLFAIPSLYRYGFSNYIYMKSDIAEKYNINSMNTFEEYTNILRTIKLKEENIIPGALNSKTLTELFARAYDYVVLDSGLSLVYKENDPSMHLYAFEQIPEFKEIIKLLSTWYKEELFKISSGASVKSFVSINESVDSTEPKIIIKGSENQKYLLYPNKPIYKNPAVGDVIYNPAMVFNAKSKNVERCLMFLDWVQKNQDNYNLLRYGIKGKHFVNKEYKNADGTLFYTPVAIESMMENYNWWRGLSFFRNIEYEKSLDRIHQFSKTQAKEIPHAGFYADLSGLETEAKERSDYFKKIFDNPLRTFNIQFDVQTIDTIIQNLKDKETDKIVKVVQAQLDQWRSQDYK